MWSNHCPAHLRVGMANARSLMICLCAMDRDYVDEYTLGRMGLPWFRP